MKNISKLFQAAGLVGTMALGGCVSVGTPGTLGASTTADASTCVTGGSLNLAIIGASASSFNKECATRRTAQTAMLSREPSIAAVGLAVERGYDPKVDRAASNVVDAIQQGRENASRTNCTVASVDRRTNVAVYDCKQPMLTIR